jgi:glycosyltransferase involved in cell wall biosynthesis
MPLSAARTPLAALPSIVGRWPAVARRARSADLLVVHGDAAAILVLPLLARRPSVWTTHGLHLLRRRPAVGPLVRQALRAATVTVCTSQAERDELRALAPELPDDRLVVVRNGIDPPGVAADRDAARGALGLEPDDVAALYLGRLEERKRPLDAVAAVAQAGAPLVLLVAGAGPLAPRIAGERVRMLGHRDEVGELLAASDIFVMPSEREGISFAVLEAMGHGLAIVVSDGPGNAEAVGGAGIVVPVGDVDALASALHRLAVDPGERERLGAAARERVAGVLTAGALQTGTEAAWRQALQTA